MWTTVGYKQVQPIYVQKKLVFKFSECDLHSGVLNSQEITVSLQHEFSDIEIELNLSCW